jgi:hypothetical protein
MRRYKSGSCPEVGDLYGYYLREDDGSFRLMMIALIVDFEGQDENVRARCLFENGQFGNMIIVSDCDLISRRPAVKGGEE